MAPNILENYLALLTIRRAGRRRDTYIVGGIFIISFISMSALGMLDRLSERSMVIVAATVFCFGFAYLTTWVRLEIIKGTMELIETLLRMNGE
jgi:quinol-cytochrome oxidoreductase complex cytochrome b subunit